MALVLLFIVLPAVELWLLIRVGGVIGAFNTVALIVLTGVLGATLARHQGLGVLRSIQRETEAGRMPASQLADGVIILLASALLITPGVLTDAFGFLCLVPGFRTFVRAQIWKRIEQAAREGRAVVYVGGFGQSPFGASRVYDVDPAPPSDDDEPPWPPRLP